MNLDDNRIETVERRSFMNLDKLRHLSLRGNKMVTISDEAFQVFVVFMYIDCVYWRKLCTNTLIQ